MELNTRTSKNMTLLWATACSYERLNNKVIIFQGMFVLQSPELWILSSTCWILCGCLYYISVLFKLQSYVGKYSLHEGETNREGFRTSCKSLPMN